MIVLSHPQGSLDWIAARLFRLTASSLAPIITSTGKLSKSEAAISAIDKLIAGLELQTILLSDDGEISVADDRELVAIMARYTGEKFSGNRHTERGHECEPDAIAELSKKIGKRITDCGMVVMGDSINGCVSCSPDGLVYEGQRIVAGCEVKSPCLSKWLGQVVAGTLPDEYKLQVHASMAICEVNTWHFASYFTGKPIFHVEVNRDAFTDTVERSLIEFRDIYAARYEIVTSALAALGKESA